MINKNNNKRILVSTVAVAVLYAALGAVLFYLNGLIPDIVLGNVSMKFSYFTAIILFVILAIISLVSIISAGKNEDDSENHKNKIIVDALSGNFLCIMYVPLEKGNKIEKVYPYCVAEKFASNVASYDKARSFPEMMNMICKGIVDSDDVERFFESTSRSLIIEKISKTASYSVDFKARYGGSEVFSELCFLPIRKKDGGITAFVFTIRDIDGNVREKIAIQDSLRDALARAQAASSAKMSFLIEISRDMRTPLNAIIGYAHLAKDHIGESEKVSDYVEKLCQSSEELISGINERIDTLRIESGKVGTDETSENLSKLLDRVIDRVKLHSLKKHQKITRNVELADKDVICDKQKLEQILCHILENAVKFTPNDGHITLSAAEKSLSNTGYAAYEFRIKDNGIGMSEEIISRIFDPYSKGNGNSPEEFGLGLTLTKAYTEMLGGTINVASKIGSGTEITVMLEFKVDTKEKKRIVSRPDFKESVETKNGADDIAERLKGKKILLVEDNELNAEIAKELLEESGFIVTVAEDGLIAVNTIFKATPGEFDLILMDIQMPVVDGFTATKRIREMDNGMQNIPIIAMTASALASDKAAALDAGMNEHIAKPINISVLNEILADFI